MPLRIIFFGTPTFAATILEYLLKQKTHVLAVITKPDKPRGRSSQLQPSPVKALAEKYLLPIYQPPKASKSEFIDILKPYQADLFVVAAYSEIFKENLLQAPRLSCINVHASLLPKYRGAAPIQRCVMAGEKESGVTIMSMAKDLDTGDILAVAKTPILPDMTSGELFETLAEIGAEALWKVIQEFEQGTISPISQNAQEATYAHKLTSQDGEIDWNRTSEIVYSHIRGVTPKPGAWCWVSIRDEKKRLMIKKAFRDASRAGSSGEIIASDPNELLVACKSGAIRLDEVQLEGKKPIPIEAFLRGIPKDKIKF